MSKYNWINLAQPSQSVEEIKQQQIELREAAAIREECQQWLATRDRPRINAWLDSLSPERREKCRQQINLMMGARK